MTGMMRICVSVCVCEGVYFHLGEKVCNLQSIWGHSDARVLKNLGYSNKSIFIKLNKVPFT